MPTIIDSLFLELGIDTSKFSKDQQRALAKIAEFEKRSKKGGKAAAQAVKTVGQAFKDLVSDSRIGASANRLDSFATKFKALGQAGRVSGGIGAPLGTLAEGLGALLSPAALGVAALGLVGVAAWDLNKKMTGLNATTYRQAQLSGMNAKNLWAWGEAARTVGAQPQDVTSGIAALQTAVTGMGVGADNATAQLVAASRLGIGWNFKSGIDIPQLFERVHELAKARGYQNLGALRALTGPLMNDAMFNIATNRSYDPAKFESYIKAAAPATLGATLAKSLKSQTVLGKLGIEKDVIAETAYGGIQGPMAALVTLMTNLLGLTNRMLTWTIKIAGYLDDLVLHFGAKLIRSFLGVSPSAKVGGVNVSGQLPHGIGAREAMGMKALMGRGMSRADAAALIGNAQQESALNPVATSDKGAHIGLFQLDKTRQSQFAKDFGYRIGSTEVPLRQQFLDELVFAQHELETSQKRAALKIAAARTLMGKTAAVYEYDERPGAADKTLGKRIEYAREAYDTSESYESPKSFTQALRDEEVMTSGTQKSVAGSVPRNAPEPILADNVLALRRELLGYGKEGLDTVSEILRARAQRHGTIARGKGVEGGKPGAPDEAEYAAAIAKALGVRTDQRLDLANRAILAKLVRVMLAYQSGLNPARLEQALKQAHITLVVGAARPNVSHSTVTHHTRIGTVAVHTQATDAEGMAAGARKALSKQPLLGPAAQHQVALATSAVAG